jgi:hypothetical protein
LTGVCRRRFDVSAARRISWSPIVRTSFAWVANCGDLASAVSRVLR